ncbi:AI-2E family transporter [Priestia filamentosa]|nr:AI-2E family transporter [Priestia filamentosa]
MFKKSKVEREGEKGFMRKSKALQSGVLILLFLTILFMLSKVSFVITPIISMVTNILAPLIIAGVLYYLLRPIVFLLTLLKIPRILAILLVFSAFITGVTSVGTYLYPIISHQLAQFVNFLPNVARDITDNIQDLQTLPWSDELKARLANNDLEKRATEMLGEVATTLGNSTIQIIDFLRNTIIVIITVPFVLFYMLKDGHKLPKTFSRFIPSAKYREVTYDVLKQASSTLSAYVQGQVIVSLFVGVCVYILYLLLGLDYALILALIALFTNLIPFVGPFIGTVPGVIVGFIQEPRLALYVIIGIIIIQQIESNLISPQVMGKKLDVHPVTVILLLLASGSFFGFVGLLLALPTYCVLKVVVMKVYELLFPYYNVHEE